MINTIAIISFLILSTVFTDNNEDQTSIRVNIEINKNVELLGFVYFLVFEGPNIDHGMIEINGKLIPRKDWHSYGYDFFKKYESLAGSANLAYAFSVADHLWLDYLINLLLQVEYFPNAHLSSTIDERYYINFSKSGDAKEAKNNVSIFLEGLNQFYHEVNFDNYLSESQEYYNNVIKQVRKNVPRSEVIDLMEKFYRKEFDRYTLIPSLTIPKGMGFGVKYPSRGRVKIYNIFGAFDFQYFKDSSALDMGFNNRKRLWELSIHEFGHSFVNPVIDQISDEVIKGTERLFYPVKKEMSDQGYNSWKICIYEHFVRAGEVIITKNIGNVEDADKLQTYYIETLKFKYLPIIIKELEEYDGSQEASFLDVVSVAMKKLKAIADKR